MFDRVLKTPLATDALKIWIRLFSSKVKGNPITTLLTMSFTSHAVISKHHKA